MYSRLSDSEENQCVNLLPKHMLWKLQCTQVFKQISYVSQDILLKKKKVFFFKHPREYDQQAILKLHQLHQGEIKPTDFKRTCLLAVPEFRETYWNLCFFKKLSPFRDCEENWEAWTENNSCRDNLSILKKHERTQNNRNISRVSAADLPIVSAWRISVYNCEQN